MSGGIWGNSLVASQDVEKSLNIDPVLKPLAYDDHGYDYNLNKTGHVYTFTEGYGLITSGRAGDKYLWHLAASKEPGSTVDALWTDDSLSDTWNLSNTFEYNGKTVYYYFVSKGAAFIDRPVSYPLCEYKEGTDYIVLTDDLAKKIAWLMIYARAPENAISYAQKPFNLNILNGDIWNFIAVEPGSWFYSVFDDHKTHHMFLLSGDEFKLLEFQDADGNGVIPHKEYHSAPITIKGKRYHSLYLSRTVDSVCPFPTEYHKRSEMPNDEYFYTQLSEYVCNWEPFDRGDVLGLLALRNLLSANSGDVNVDIDDLKTMLKGYTVNERQNPYLDDPNLDDTGHPTVSFHD